MMSGCGVKALRNPCLDCCKKKACGCCGLDRVLSASGTLFAYLELIGYI